MANILITSEMLTELKLQGNDLLVYALIYGFSKDGQGCFYGRREYIADTLNISLATVARVLKKLTESGLLKKDLIIHNGAALPVYTATTSKATDPKPEKREPKAETEQRSKARPSSAEEVREYCTEKGIDIDADAFFDHYTANGWKVGPNPMKDWRAAVRYWKTRNYKQTYERRDRREIGGETPVVATCADDYRQPFIRR